MAFSAFLPPHFTIARTVVGEGTGTVPVDEGKVIMYEKLFYTISDTCRLLSVGRTKLYELIGSGEIPVRKLGKKSLVAATDLTRWAERLPALPVKDTEQANVKAGGVEQ
jgi:excisionase family DNA binding protein